MHSSAGASSKANEDDDCLLSDIAEGHTLALSNLTENRKPSPETNLARDVYE